MTPPDRSEKFRVPPRATLRVTKAAVRLRVERIWASREIVQHWRHQNKVPVQQVITNMSTVLSQKIQDSRKAPQPLHSIPSIGNVFPSWSRRQRPNSDSLPTFQQGQLVRQTAMRLCIDKSLLCLSCGLLMAARTAQTTNAEEFLLQKASSRLAVMKRLPTITPKNLTLNESEDVLTLTCTVGYTNFGTVFWTLYDRDLKDIGHVEESNASLNDGQTVAKVSVLRIGGWQVLPTDTGVYPFKCNTFADFKVASDTALVRTVLTDTCGSAVPGKCEARGARCVDNRCACVDERHPFQAALPAHRLLARGQARSALLLPGTWNSRPAKAIFTCMLHVLARMGHQPGRHAGALVWPGYGRSEDASHCEPRPSGGLRARCGKHADCAALNARCVYSHCECGLGMVALNGGSGPCVNATRAPQLAPTVINRIPPAVSPRRRCSNRPNWRPKCPLSAARTSTSETPPSPSSNNQHVASAPPL
ncbi:hypothetical protein HPB47_016965 [Ixodes persulcatus]|uniref:Uncharacterized protein n=1 Tax=Ixodes persulcatus TaxID=34615 RepID=A0AC60QPJ2_IXOPE|nr:hypothetical protein HPB47_016965 [Ixodes persulcatus]